MNKKDNLEKLLDLNEDAERSTAVQQQVTQQIVSKAKGQQSTNDFLEFGFVKIWTIVLEFFNVFYVQSQNNQKNIHGIVNRGDKNES